MDTPQRIETLYLPRRRLSRKPCDKEMLRRATKFIEAALKADDKPLSQEEKDKQASLSTHDRRLVLKGSCLNSGEFLFNH